MSVPFTPDTNKRDAPLLSVANGSAPTIVGELEEVIGNVETAQE